MRWSWSGWLPGLLLTILVPVAAGAQDIARSFEQLQGLLDTSAVVLVTDRAGLETWGRVVAVSPSALTLAVMEKDGPRTLTTSARRSFVPDDVVLVARSDVSGDKGPVIYPASWHEVEALHSDAALTVTLDTGERRSYRLTSVAPDRLLLVSSAGQREAVDKSRISRVVRHGVDDPVGNGILAGALTGAGAAWASVAIGEARCGPSCNYPPDYTAMAVAFVGLGAGAGAFVGWMVDRFHKGTEVIFPVAPAARSTMSVAPILSSRGKGVSMSIRF